MKINKFLLSCLILLSFIFFMTSCTDEPEVNAKAVTIAENCNSEFSLICRADTDFMAKDLYDQFAAELSRRTKATFQVTPEGDTAGKEILLGIVNRPEASALQLKLTAAGGDRFGIMVSESAVAVNGTNLHQTYLALDYLLSNYITADKDGNAIFALPLGLEYISDVNPSLNGDDIPQLVSSGKGIVFYPGKTILTAPSQGEFNSTQGCGYDGTYVYVAKVDTTPNDPEHGKILKFRMDTGELVAVSDPLPTNHTNDICYDPTTGLLIIAGANGTGKYLEGRLISFVDPNTLTLVKTMTANMYLRSVEYCPELDVYFIAGGPSARAIYRYNKDFEEISSFECKGNKYTVQAFCTDGKYIYDPRYVGRNSSIHYMNIHTVDGDFIGEIPILGLQGQEPESMFIADGKFYMCCGISSKVYELEMLPNTYWK